MAFQIAFPHVRTGQQRGPAYVVHLQEERGAFPLVTAPVAVVEEIQGPLAIITEIIGTV